jgi:DnaJ like chaperone protein
MTVWKWIADAACTGAESLAALFNWAGGLLSGIADNEQRRQVAFSMALIALSAKMAKADGVVTMDEVAAFHRVFTVPPGEARNVERLFDLARQDVAGFDAYARRIAGLYEGDRAALEDVLDGLFVIAKADGAVHPNECAFLKQVGAIFGFDAAAFERISMRHVVPEEGDPYVVIGAERGWPWERLRGHYRKLVSENHPDRLIARGLPAEFIAIATDRLATINRAWERIEKERRVPSLASPQTV